MPADVTDDDATPIEVTSVPDAVPEGSASVAEGVIDGDGVAATRPDEPRPAGNAGDAVVLSPATTAELPPATSWPAQGRTIRFVFELDPETRFSFVSADFAQAVGPTSADVTGRTWSGVASDLGIDPLGRVANALGRRDTFTGITVDWPVEATTLRVPVDLAGMPVFGRDRSFRGYRGFGVAKCGAAFDTGTPITVALPASGPLTEEELRAGTAVVEAEVDDGADLVDIAPMHDHGDYPDAVPDDLTLAADIADAASAPGNDPFDLPPGVEAAYFETLETEAEADLEDVARLDGVPDHFDDLRNAVGAEALAEPSFAIRTEEPPADDGTSTPVVDAVDDGEADITEPSEDTAAPDDAPADPDADDEPPTPDVDAAETAVADEQPDTGPDGSARDGDVAAFARRADTGAGEVDTALSPDGEEPGDEDTARVDATTFDDVGDEESVIVEMADDAEDENPGATGVARDESADPAAATVAEDDGGPRALVVTDGDDAAATADGADLPEPVAVPSEVMTDLSEAGVDPSEGMAERSELLADPSEVVADMSEIVADPSDVTADMPEAVSAASGVVADEVPAFEPEVAEDLGEDWPATDPDPEPVNDYGLVEPAEAIEADAGVDAAETGGWSPDAAGDAFPSLPPDVDPAAPDAAPDAMLAEDEEPAAAPAEADETIDAVDDGAAEDIVWRTPERASGEIIPSPIVPRLVPEQAVPSEDAARLQLSRPEREAFQKIAEALGARMEATADTGRPSDAAAASPVRRDPPLPIDVALLDRLPVAVAILKDGEAVIVNRAFLELTGYPDHAALDQAGGFAEAFAGSALPRDASLPAIRRRDGVEVPVHARLHSIPWHGGVASLLVVQETASATGRERAEAAEARVEELDAILDTATDGVLVLDAHGTVLGANRSAEALFGTDRSRMVGESILSMLAPESHRAALDYLDGLSRNGVASVLNDGREVIGRVPQGGLVPLFMTIGRISSGKFCAVLRDITQWKRAEEELVSAKRSAETASSQKSDFLAKISHEIRTPLNAIIGFSEVMMEERFGPVGSERYKEYLRDIHISGAHIMSLVNDLLDLSKIEAGKLDLAFEAVALNEVIRECVALMQPQANRDRIIIRTSLSSSLPNVVADNRSLRQIVLNLVSNAIKFNTPGGQVIVSTIYEECGEVAIRVRDTGTGMSEDDIGKALEPFRQLHTARRGRGTGLGLPLTKALVEANRAAFRIESAVGQGTLVQVTFPSTRVLAE
jgi:PAS domain S-box-containing protein